MWPQAAAVFNKEWRDAIRDRRSLIAALAYALAGPLLVATMLVALGRNAERDETPVVAIAGADRAKSLVTFLDERRIRIVPAAGDIGAAIRDRQIEVALVVPEGFPDRFHEARPADLYLAYDSTRGSARRMLPKVRAALDEYGRETAAARLVLHGVSPAVAHPLRVRERDVSTAASRAAMMLAALPIFLLLAPFISSMNLAIDVTAGERERNSLEPLLTHPVRLSALAAGKWVPAVLLSGAGTVLTLVIAQAVLRSRRLQALDATVGLAWSDTGVVLAILLPLALFAPAVQMLIAMFSRSYKEAQTYLSLLLFLPMIPGFLFAFDAARPSGWMAAAPVVGQQVLLERVLRGEAFDVMAWTLLTLATLLLAVACVAATARLMASERIVLGR